MKVYQPNESFKTADVTLFAQRAASVPLTCDLSSSPKIPVICGMRFYFVLFEKPETLFVPTGK